MLDYELIKPFRKATLHDSNGDITKRIKLLRNVEQKENDL